MKSFLRISACLAAGVAALFATGCAKKPIRPNPYDTVMGGQGGTLNPQEGLFGPDAGELTARSSEDPFSNARWDLYGPVYFDFDSATIRVAERSKVEQAANDLKANPAKKVVLRGHCDWRGTTEYNMGLGDRRANAVRDYLATLGIPASRVTTVSRGDLDAVEGGAESQMQQDRRVDIGLY